MTTALIMAQPRSQSTVNARYERRARHTRVDGAVRSESGIERRGPIVQVEVDILDAMGRRSRGPRLREIGGQTEVPQDPFYRGGVFDEREEPQPPATTPQDVEPKGTMDRV